MYVCMYVCRYKRICVCFPSCICFKSYCMLVIVFHVFLFSLLCSNELSRSLSLSLCLSLCVFSPVLDNKEGVAVSACVFLLLTACVCVGFLFVLLFGATSYFLFFNNYSYIKKPICCQHCFQYFWVLDGVYCLCWPQAPET